tara:strand:+ start:7290 stop:7805 length:516 start_codon:yes stop_codon:yes gene_type:complete
MIDHNEHNESMNTEVPQEETPATTRADREMDDRELNQRPQTWQPPSLIPEPVKLQGYVYRWVRASVMKNSQPDAANLMAKRREGWEPVRVEEQPHFKGYIDEERRFQDSIEVSGLVLCKCPEDFMKQRADYMEKRTASQMKSVNEHFMRDGDARMPKFNESESKVTTFGNG